MCVRSNPITGSFRDPSGFLFRRENLIYRQVNSVYQPHYDFLIRSGLYESLVERNLLIPHREVDIPPEDGSRAYKIIQPDIIPFVSYPYEWCFSQLKSAALTTLRIQKEALGFNMSLKDASAYNMQIYQGKPILIDTLSFEKYEEGQPWIAYRQFCQHFLAPLTLMSLKDARLNQLFRVYMDGIPLDLASLLLPDKSWLRFGILMHIHLHAKSQKYYGDKKGKAVGKGLSKRSLGGIIDSLEATIKKLDWKPAESEWGNYYKDTNYSPEALGSKKEIIRKYLEKTNPQFVWDLGANTGLFSRISSERKIQTVAFDMDHAAVERNYHEVIRNNEKFLLPLCLDLTNPSSGIGWENTERASLQDRGPVDAIFALALLHHLAIANNLPLGRIASFLSKLCRYLIIEFVPKSDSQAQRLLTSRKDIFPHYTKEDFEGVFSFYFQIECSDMIAKSDRTLYLMKVRGDTNK